MPRLVVTLCLCALLVVGIPAFAQKGNPLVGTWEAVSVTREGKELTPSSEGAPPGVKPGVNRRIFTADGHYMQVYMSIGRPAIATPANQRTKEELLSAQWGAMAQFGTYTVSGDKLTLKIISALNPAQEGQQRNLTFRMDGADLLVSSTPPDPQSTTRWRRAK
jgi:hypothetical protein